MHRFALAFTLLLTSAMAAAVEKDDAYYKEHLDEAKAKYDACQQRVAELAGAGKISEMMQVAGDPECKAAEKVIMIYQNNGH